MVCVVLYLGKNLGKNQRKTFFFSICQVKKVVDLCAAPGSWSQVLSRKLRPKTPDGKPDVSEGESGSPLLL